MRKILILTTLALSLNVSACTSKDAWTGPDKNKHVAVGVAMGTAGTLVFKDANKSFLVGTGVALAKEVYDSRGKGTCSLQDFLMTSLGVAAGAYGTAWIVTPRFVGMSMRF